MLGRHVQGGDVLLLAGELGAGKTCLTQGIVWGLGVEGYARSPTFVIATRYKGGRLLVNHIDLYRIGDPLEALELGLEEYLSGDDLCVVEWADRASDLFAGQGLSITLEYGAQETQRLLTITPRDETSVALCDRLKRDLPLGVETR